MGLVSMTRSYLTFMFQFPADNPEHPIFRAHTDLDWFSHKIQHNNGKIALVAVSALHAQFPITYTNVQCSFARPVTQASTNRMKHTSITLLSSYAHCMEGYKHHSICVKYASLNWFASDYKRCVRHLPLEPGWVDTHTHSNIRHDITLSASFVGPALGQTGLSFTTEATMTCASIWYRCSAVLGRWESQGRRKSTAGWQAAHYALKEIFT